MTSPFSKYEWLLLGALALWSGCVEKSELYPTSGSEECVSIRYFCSLYNASATTITSSLYISGYVIANNRYGSFPGEIVIEDETGGLTIKIGDDDSGELIAVGKQVVIRCQGLVLGDYGGELSLGSASSDELYENSYMSSSQRNAVITVLEEEAITLEPRMVSSISELQSLWVACFVALPAVEFRSEDLGLGWCDDGVSTTRYLIDKQGDLLQVRTSSEALFAGELLPEGSGYIEGILGYFNDSLQLRVPSPASLVFDQERF